MHAHSQLLWSHVTKDQLQNQKGIQHINNIMH